MSHLMGFVSHAVCFWTMWACPLVPFLIDKFLGQGVALLLVIPVGFLAASCSQHPRITGPCEESEANHERTVAVCVFFAAVVHFGLMCLYRVARG